MTTKTTINLSPIKRCHGSAYLKKRRLITLINHRKQTSSSTMNTDVKSNSLPDLLRDIHLEQQRRENIVHIANLLRKVGDQMDEQLQINNSSSIDDRFSRSTLTLLACLSTVFRFFL